MSAIGPKRTSLVAAHMSAFGGKADMTICGMSAFAVAIGVKQTCPFAMHMSAFDPSGHCGHPIFDFHQCRSSAFAPLSNNMRQCHLTLFRNCAICLAGGLLLAVATMSAYAQGDDAKKQAISSYTQECITEEKIVQENKWTESDEFGRYKGNDAYLFAETVSPELMRSGPDYSFDTVIVWGGPNVWGFAVAFPFKNGCALGHWFVGGAYRGGVQMVEKYRQSGNADFEQFLSTPKNNYYQAERYYSEHRYGEAEQLYTEALNEFRKIGPYAPSVNMALHKIALLNDALGKFNIAEKNYMLAIRGWSTSLGPGSVYEAKVRADFVGMLRRIGREADAEAWSK